MREEEILAAVRAAFPEAGDDASWELGGMARAMDMAVPGRHFIPSRPHGWEEGAWHAVARVVSDLGAVGARPGGALAGLALPSGAGRAEFEGVITGLRAAGDAFGVEVVGGDLALADGALISVAGWGTDARGPGRAGGEPGDLVAVTGSPGARPLGWALAMAGRGQEAEHLVEAAVRPWPPWEAGRALAGHAHAMMDLSDGLGLDLARLASASGVGFEVHADPPWPDNLESLRRGLGVSLADLRAAGGDYELLAMVPPAAEGAAKEALGALGSELTVIGVATPAEDGRWDLRGGAREAWEPRGSEIRWS